MNTIVLIVVLLIDDVKVPVTNKHLISGLIREKNDLGLIIETITKDNINSFINDPLIPRTTMQRLDKILLYYYKNTETYGTVIHDEFICYSRGYAKNAKEYIEMIKALNELGYLDGDFSSDKTFYDGKLTIKGMIRAEELTTTNICSTKVFVAMGFKPDLIEAHNKSIKPACKECGFDAFLVSETEHNRDINDKIISDIKTSKFVVTDFTYNNPGAYFEAGFAQGRGLEVIRTCKKAWYDETNENGEKNRLHFDINHYNIIFWEDYEDLKDKLKYRIRATIL